MPYPHGARATPPMLAARCTREDVRVLHCARAAPSACTPLHPPYGAFSRSCALAPTCDYVHYGAAAATAPLRHVYGRGRLGEVCGSGRGPPRLLGRAGAPHPILPLGVPSGSAPSGRSQGGRPPRRCDATDSAAGVRHTPQCAPRPGRCGRGRTMGGRALAPGLVGREPFGSGPLTVRAVGAWLGERAPRIAPCIVCRASRWGCPARRVPGRRGRRCTAVTDGARTPAGRTRAPDFGVVHAQVSELLPCIVM